MRKRIAVLSLLLLGGCGHREMTEIAISPDLLPAEQEASLLAAEEWFAAEPGLQVPVFIGSGKNGSVVFSSGGDKCETEGAYLYTSLNTFKAPKIVLCPRFRHEEPGNGLSLSDAIRHEIGHALSGRDDHLGKGHTMSFQTADMVDHLTSEDLAYVQ